MGLDHFVQALPDLVITSPYQTCTAGIQTKIPDEYLLLAL